ncbi:MULTISPECIES: hypothetical protein [Mesorhizobium]|uniref:Uncharacterized protein n=1 Tax=Mesorhizobium opportunistum (strain LMG 24607 / HAMBI 3007 / WSM2075) TaxID=536019 RepID=F7YCS6_MESOW|nr:MULTISPECIES: hypothetical protein [Mesorhizobium]AEH88966.1 conserved hypothetical protein [Mesorhizobium opportunistum WSM2075]MCA0033645.1 hypothetical protein [Mesorhizobium sp. B263B2A]TPN57498.1 hypothetical protein FJ978_02570 [Mesorhizobium sp. B1-1-7]TPN57544.1 hypothetical protein FJ976_02590 [Mesorhizobium sp. B1-1-9]
MRKFFTSLFAFILSGLAGGLVAQELAVVTDAQEEYILVFMASVLVTIIVTFVFFVAQLMSDPPATVGKTGMWLLIVFVALLVLLIAAILYTDGSMTAVKGDIPIVLGLGLPGLVIILVQWLFVRWRLKRGMANMKAG